MSVAFTKEQDSEAAAADLPDRPISSYPNLVTERGLRLLDEGLAAARAAYSAAQANGDVQADRTAMARATRDLRYYTARRASARLVPPSSATDAVQFGSRVTFRRQGGRQESYRIVGEDEADPTQGSIAYVAPLARALLNREVGDEVQVGGATVEIVSVEAG
jgi:transcription elongation GreA/GreB family factor